MDGTGAPQNYVEAAKWLILAKARTPQKSNLLKDISHALLNLEAKMSP